MLACPSRRFRMLTSHLEETVTRLDCRPNSRMNRFPGVWSKHSLYPLLSLMLPFGQSSILDQRTQKMRLTFRPGITKTGIESWGELNEPIRVEINFSLFPRYIFSDVNGKRHVVHPEVLDFQTCRWWRYCLGSTCL